MILNFIERLAFVVIFAYIARCIAADMVIDMKEQHLEFIQNNISRMNQCSFQMKGWAITLVSALIAIYVTTFNELHIGNKMYIYIAIVCSILFWILDSMYLAKENRFIGIYNDVAEITDLNERKIVKEYEMPLKAYKGWKYSIFKAMISPSEIVLYASIIAILVVMAFCG